MNYVKLSTKNYIEVENLIKAQKLFKESDSTLGRYISPSLLELQYYYFDDSVTNYAVYGAYDMYGVIQSCLFVCFSTDARYWHIKYAMKQPFATWHSIFPLIDLFLAEAEIGNYNKGYYYHIEINANRIENIVRRKTKLAFQYLAFTEEVISKRTRSSYPKYWIDFQHTTMHSFSTVVKEYILPDERRSKC
jgi:hypothetical protein